MTIEQAKFILQAYRPGGKDAADPMFTEALALIEREPALKAWWERESTFDREVSSRCRQVAPPSNLRAALLAGGQVSRSGPVKQRRWFLGAGLAASMVVAFSLFAVNSQNESRVYLDQLVQHGLAEMSGPHPRGQALDRYGELGTWLTDSSRPLGQALPVDVDALRAIGCRSFELAGKEVFEICFRRDSWYHLYIAKRSEFVCRECEIEPMFRERGEFASVSWVDDDHVYVLVSRAGLNAVKRVIADPSLIAMR